MRFGRKSHPAYYRGNTIEVDLNDHMSTGEIFDALDCDGELHLHLTDKKFPIRYSIDAQSLVFGENTKRDFAENKTMRANTDNRLCHNLFFKENLNHKIAHSELGGGGDLKQFLEYMEMAPDGAAADNIQELKGIASRQPIGHKRGPVDDRILKLLVYGDQLTPGAHIKLGR